jgi:hypothetical protein
MRQWKMAPRKKNRELETHNDHRLCAQQTQQTHIWCHQENTLHYRVLYTVGSPALWEVVKIMSVDMSNSAANIGTEFLVTCIQRKLNDTDRPSPLESQLKIDIVMQNSMVQAPYTWRFEWEQPVLATSTQSAWYMGATWLTTGTTFVAPAYN